MFRTCNTSKKKMSFISVRNLSPQTTKDDLRVIFRVFGKIKYIDYKKPRNPDQNFGKATILFAAKNSALQACEYDQTFLHGNIIDVSVKLKSKKLKMKDLRPYVFSLKEALIILLVFSISFLTHFTKVYWPNDVVYTESITGRCVNDYISKKRLFDFEPPLHSLTYYAYAKYICGYNGTFPFRKIQYPKSFDHVKLRHLPCLLSTLVAPILTASLLLKNCTLWSSFLIGVLFAFDFISIVLGKLFIREPLEYFLVSCTILLSSMLSRFNTYGVFCLQVIFAALAYTTNLNTLCCTAFVIVTNFNALKNKKFGIDQFISRIIIGFVLFFSVVFFICGLHLYLTPNVGKGDRYLPNNFRKMSIYSQVIIYLKTVAEYHNKYYQREDGYNTFWLRWPLFLATPSLIWTKNANTQIIAAFNNPVTAITSFFGVINSLFIRKREWFIGYFVSMAPFIFIYKHGLSINYEIPLIFGICSFAFTLDRMSKYLRGSMIILLIIALICAFFIWYDWLYAVPMSYNTFDKTMIWPKLREILNWERRKN